MLFHSQPHRPIIRTITSFGFHTLSKHNIPTQKYSFVNVFLQRGSEPAVQNIKAIGAAVDDCGRASRSISHEADARKRPLSDRQPEIMRASITVEAALALPICLGVFLLLICLFKAMRTCEDVNRQLCSAVRKTAAFSVSQDGVSTADAYKAFYESLAEAGLDSSFIRGGAAGIVLKVKDDGTGSGIIRIEATYRLRLPGFVIGARSFTVHDAVNSRVWTGIPLGGGMQQENENGGRRVYVAENGIVYHTNAECTHIRLVIQKIPYNSLSSARNIYRKKYYPCEKCAVEGTAEVYISPQGDSWHSRRECSGLKRSVVTMTEKAADRKGLRPCPKCGGD